MAEPSNTRHSPATRARSALLALAAALAVTAVCIGVRLPWIDKVGFAGDLLFFRRWATAASYLRTSPKGMGYIYQRQRDCNYPPLYLYVLSYLPAVDTWWHGSEGWTKPRVQPVHPRLGREARTRSHFKALVPTLKVPAIVADVAITLLVLFWAWGRAGPQRAVVAAGLWALNPLSVYNSAFFGQIDAIHSFWMLAALLAAVDGRIVWAWSLVSLALLTKLQSIVVVPVIALLTAQPLLDSIRRADIAALRRRLLTLFVAAVAAGAITAAVLAPFWRADTLGDVGRVYRGAVSDKDHARLTVIAYNLWWLTLDLPVKRVKILSDRKPLIGPITGRQVGFALLALLTAVSCALALWGGGRCAALLAAALIALAFFLVSTQMKARYGFSSVVLMLPLITCGYRYGLAVVVLTMTFLINCARVAQLPAGFFGLTEIIARTAKVPWMGHAIATVNLAVLGYLLFEAVRCARRERRTAGAHSGA